MSDLTPHRIDDELWEIAIGSRPGMRVPARVFADAQLLSAIEQDHSLEQLARVHGADLGAVSARARERGSRQIGTLGSGNHFIELQRIDSVYDEAAARAYGLHEGQVTLLIHSGSRGLGHQVCTDFVKRMDASLPRHGIRLPDRQLSCAPASSREGRDYLAAMAAAANFAWANRHVMAHGVREAVRVVLGDAVAD